MKIYDISQEILSCKVYPGDPIPQKTQICSMEKGDLYDLSSFSMCAHNGTHIDAPRHFIMDGKTVDELGLEPFVGDCFVARHEGDVTGKDAEEMLRKAEGARRLLIGGKAVVTAEAASIFAGAGLLLVGNESQTVGPEDGPMQVHRILLGAGLALLEGVVLADVPEGKYFLSAAPLNLAGCEGSPCRAFLMG